MTTEEQLKEFRKGFENALLYGEETYEVDEKGNLRFVTNEEFERIKNKMLCIQ